VPMPEHGDVVRKIDPGVGDPSADLSELYEHHGPAVRGLCHILLRNRHEAEDAAQQTFLSAYRSMLGGTVPRHPAAWLATIARNECVRRIQRRMREPLPSPEAEDALPDPVAVAAERADLVELWRAIGELPERQRQALLLREFSGLSYSELAKTLAVSEPAVESLLFRARDALRVRLQPALGSLAGIAPFVLLRNVVAKVAEGAPDTTALGGLGRIAGAPLVAKVVAGAAAIVAAGGAVAVVEQQSNTPPRVPPDLAAIRAHAEQPAPVVPTSTPASSRPLPQHTRRVPSVRARSAPAAVPATPALSVEPRAASTSRPVSARQVPAALTWPSAPTPGGVSVPAVPSTFPVAPPGDESMPQQAPADTTTTASSPADGSSGGVGPIPVEPAAPSSSVGTDTSTQPATDSGSASGSAAADDGASGGAGAASADSGGYGGAAPKASKEKGGDGRESGGAGHGD
jgi:RNA polymerase sigma factor (sigma-70 family)